MSPLCHHKRALACSMQAGPTHAANASMKVLPGLVVCPRCDAVYQRPQLKDGQTAHCSSCDTVVERPRQRSVDGWLALTLTSAILFTLANLFPVIQIGVQNFQNDVTLWEATTSLAKGLWLPLAAPAIIVAVIAPMLQIILLGWVLMFTWLGKPVPCFRQAMKLLAAVQPWSMVEVAMLSIIVAGIKLSSMANVSLGAGTWSMLALTCLTVFTTKRDVRWLWQAHGSSASAGFRTSPT